MKKILITAALTLMAAITQAATVNPASVDAQAINCLFNVGCTNTGVDTNSTITLPGTSGTGLLLTRVTVGGSNSPAAGLYGYEYRIDLSGVTSTNPPCVSNVVLCVTNRVPVTLTNVTVCCTNHQAAADVVDCVTFVIPGTNIVTTITNSFPATNVVRCVTFPSGFSACFTNSFAATNYVLSVTNHVPPQYIVICQTNHIAATNIVTCVTTNIHTYTNILACTSNNIICPESTPCITALRLRFGPTVTNLDFDTNGLSDLVYVVTNGISNNTVPAEITLDDGKLVLHFSPPLCPGSSSVSVGLVSTNAPRDISAKLKLSTDGKLVVASRAPIIPIPCDFSNLVSLIGNLQSTDILPANSPTWQTRRTALLTLAQAAQTAAAAGNADDVTTALSTLVDHTTGNASWLTKNAARLINQAIASVSDCVADAGHGDNDGDDNDDNDDNDDQHGHGH